MIFISYRKDDSKQLVGRLYADLVRAFGDNIVFRDQDCLKGGDNWSDELEQKAKNCDVMLVVIGADWEDARYTDAARNGDLRLRDPEDWVRKEITLALDAGKIVIPVLVDRDALPPEVWLARSELQRLYKKQWVRLRDDPYAHDLNELIGAMRNKCPRLPSAAVPNPPATAANPPAATKSLPVPPALYAVPNYILTSTFIGRATELDLLDAWACSNDPLMVVEGIGGLGKSALTWEWTINRAAKIIPDLAGRVWWSFYERGASMSAFVRHALAYITGQAPDALSKETSHYERSQQLLTELKRRPFLLVLDGFERVLTAYQRWDKAQQRDDKIEANLRECADPRDGELLQQLLHASPSKVMVSTRLFPSILEDRASAKPARGVAHHELDGLSRPDALAFFRNAGIKGRENEMLDFAAQFGYHSLLLKVICGEITQYPKKPGDFDAWRADPIYGGKLKLSELDLKQRYNHILKFALEGLDEQKRKLLCRIAVLSENVDYDVLAVFNPFLPPNPKKPMDEAMPRHQDSSEHEQAIRAFDKALIEFHDRGLLQWEDRDEKRHYEMHPVVRGYAADFLGEAEKRQTFLAARDHFTSMPPDDLDKATELVHVARSVEIYRCLIGAGLLEEAASFYRGRFATTLGFNLGAHTLVVEFLTPLFRGGQEGLPNLASAANQSHILNWLAISLGELGREEESVRLVTKALNINLTEEDYRRVATTLRNLAISAWNLGRWAEYTAAITIALELSEAAHDVDGVATTIVNQAGQAIIEGRFADGERLLADFHAGPLPHPEYYRPGNAEY